MEGSESKRRKVVSKKNDLVTKLQKKFKKKINKKVKRNDKRDEGFNGIRQCRKNGIPEHRRLRTKGVPGHEGMFLKGLRTQYISRQTLNEANEARKNEDINKIIDIGRVFQKGGPEDGGGKRAFNLKPAHENRKSKKISEKDLTLASEDFSKCSLSAISKAETTTEPVLSTDATIIIQENDVTRGENHTATGRKKKLNFDKELVMFSMLYEENVGSRLLPRLTEKDVLKEAVRGLRDRPKKDKSRKDEAVENEFVREFKFLREKSEPDIPLTKIFPKDFHHRNHARVAGSQSSDIFMGFTENPAYDLINLNEMRTSENDVTFTHSFDEKQHKTVEIQAQDLKKSNQDFTIPPPIQFYRRNMF